MITDQRINDRTQFNTKPVCQDPDSDLVARAQAGDRDAFGLLMLRHRDRISSVIFTITKNQGDTEDEVQETFLCAYRGLREFRRDSKFISWLTRIAINRARICLRKRRHWDIPLAIECEGEFLNQEIPEWRPDPEQCYAEKESDRKLNEKLTTLPDCLRSVLILKHFHGYTGKEIAKRLGISVSAVKSRVIRARQRLGVGLVEHRYSLTMR